MITEELKKLYITHTGHEPEAIDELPSSGSNRRYFRLKGTPTLIGVSGESVEENRAFLYMAEHFRGKGLPVPEVFIRSEDNIYYLQEDLGDTLLFNAIEKDARQAYSMKRRSNCFVRPCACCPPCNLPEPTAWTSPTVTRRLSSTAVAFCGT